MFIPSKPFLPINLLDEQTVEIECFPRQSIPTIVKLLLQRQYRSSWEVGKHREGRNMIARAVMAMYESCNSPTAQAVDRVYTLLERSLVGTVRAASVDANGKVTYSPALPAVPNVETINNNNILKELVWARYAIDNGLHGEPNERFSDARQYRQQLDDILAALQAGEDVELEEIIGLLGQIVAVL